MAKTYEAIHRASVKKNDPKNDVWVTDSGKELGCKVQELKGQGFIIQSDDGTQYTARFGVVDDGEFRQFCSVVYCDTCKIACTRRQTGTACREFYDNGRPRDKGDGRYYVELTTA